MTKAKNNKLIVVLGMHRSGTSVITKSLELMGVGLGDDLYPPDFDNPKGFWEDQECIIINETLLRYLGSGYDRLGLAWDNVQTDFQVSELKLRATQHISRKLIENDGIWGFKDPRTCRLLGFWNEVFLALKCNVSIVIAIRNPASVAASLAARNRISAEKAYFLWLQHVLPALRFMKGARGVVVDYDELLANPYAQIIRISSKLDLPLPDRESSVVKDFENNFLESDLRHTRYTENELALDSRASSMVAVTYNLLLSLAKDQESHEDLCVQNTLNELNTRLREMSPAFDYINILEDEQMYLKQAVVGGEVQIASLNQSVAERDGQINAYRLQAEQFDEQLRAASVQITSLSQAVAERDGQIASLSQAVGERDGQIASFNQTVAERGEQINAYRLQAEQFDEQLRAASVQITSLSQAVAERDGQIASLSQAVGERDGQIASLNQALHEWERRSTDRLAAIVSDLTQEASGRDVEIASLNQLVLERDGQIEVLNQALVERNQEVTALRASTSWLITLPLRFVSRLLSGKHKDFCFVESRGLKQSTSLVERTYERVPQYRGELPDDFDRDVYIKLNPDLAAAGVDPTTHYLLHGRHEGRIFSLPDLSVLCVDQGFKVDFETILVVSHEASRTGAPILTLNVVQAFVKSYNVVVLLLGGGALSDEFRRTGATVITSPNLRRNQVLADMVVNQLCERFNFKFALVNSIESRAVLPGLGNCFVPSISLVHEFASYTRPRDSIRDALFWSGEVVFSANITMENAYTEYPDLGDQSAHVLPQGRCLLPLGESSEEQHQVESTRIRRLIRPKSIADNSVIVLGAGAVQLRKGVDLFIECAARVLRAPGGDRCRFVWVGQGYDPENDLGYSVYLADQIRRAKLEGHVFFIDETTAIETAYEEADLFLLSSRLDPLPNVAIDAMSYGVPVLCFNKTTGIADFLIDSDLGNYCVAEYLDSADMAEKILALAGSNALREDIASQCREASVAYFNMAKYVARLEALAQDVCDRTQQEKADTQVILASGLFRRDYSCPPQRQGQSIELEVRAYVRAWASGIGHRKPFPGFHPGIYLEQHGVAVQGADPFADYLQAGKPDGPWICPVIVAKETSAEQLPSDQRIALHIHAYYPELLPEIFSRLLHNRICPDLFISITNENARQLVINELKSYQGRVVDIQCVPNRGRDIGPLLTAFGQRLVANYDFVGHIHTKKSADVKDATMGQSWYRFLLGNLLGGESGSMADSILAKMKDDTSIGIVFPDDPHVVGLGANRAFAEVLAERVGLEKLPEYFIFPIGTMFWARASALLPLMSLNLGWDDYPEEPLPYDGSALHAIERLFSLALSIGNMRSATTNVNGLTR